MKVLLVHNHYQQPGGEDTVFAQERQLLERFDNQVLTYQRSNSELLHSSIAQRLSTPKNAIWASDVRRDVLRLLQKERPSVVHVHNTFTQISPSVYSACREAGVPVIQTLHNFRLLCPAATYFRNGKICEECRESGLWRGVNHACYRGSVTATAVVALMLAVHRRLHTWMNMVDGYIALTQFARQKFLEGGVIPAEKISVKPNFVDPDPGEGTGTGDFAAFVGRLSPEKGLRTLLDAWRRIPGTVPLQIVGDGPLRPELERYVSCQRLSNVSFRGRLQQEETRSVIKSARLLLLPSECYENFPMTIVEAFSCGTPVVCSRLGAMQEIVTDGVNGLHFTPGNPQALAECVKRAWNHPEQLQAMGRAARREYERKYTARTNYALLMDIYHRASASIA